MFSQYFSLMQEALLARVVVLQEVLPFFWNKNYNMMADKIRSAISGLEEAHSQRLVCNIQHINPSGQVHFVLMSVFQLIITSLLWHKINKQMTWYGACKHLNLAQTYPFSFKSKRSCMAHDFTIVVSDAGSCTCARCRFARGSAIFLKKKLQHDGR